MYPEIIKPLYRSKNLYSQGCRGMNRFNYDRAKGKYIAMCEGDDYWTDPLKLQKQIDFLEENSDFSGCTHACEVEYINENRRKKVRFKGKSEIDFGYYLKKNPFFATASLLFKKEVVENYPEWTRNLFAGDFTLKYMILSKGKIKYFDESMSVYRRGVAGSWSKLKLTQERIDKEYRDDVLSLQKINEMLNYRFTYESIIKSKKLFRTYLSRSIVASRGGEKIKLFLSNILLFRINDYKTLLQGSYKKLNSLIKK